MTAATERVGMEHDAQRLREYTLLSGEEAMEGWTALGDPTTGKVLVGASPASGKLTIGVFHEDCDASAADATCTVDHCREIVVLWRANDGSITSSSIFNKCYVVDNQTVGLASTNRALAGTILLVDETEGVGFAVGCPFLENT